MPKNEPSQKRLNVEGIDSTLFRDFKMSVLFNESTIKEVIIAHLSDYVKSAEKSLEKMREKT